MSKEDASLDEEAAKIMERKRAGILIPLKERVEARASSTYFEHIHLIHNALPEINFEDIDTSTRFLGHSFGAPILIDAMTGGIDEAAVINSNLALAAEEFKLGMVVGSQRAGLKSEQLAETYSVARKNAPSIFLGANIGGAQLAKGFSVEDAQKLIDMISANAFIVHLNPIQELIQPEGEPFFRGVLSKIRELVSSLKVPVIVKEVGAGISREVALKLELAGVAAINVSGSGGTSWAGVESYRADKEGDVEKSELGALFWDWGIPTAASLIEVRRAVSLPLISSGGMRTGMDVAKSIVLGADLCGMALPMLKTAAASKEALFKFIRKTTNELRATMFGVGAADVKTLKKVRYVATGPLKDWFASMK